MIPKRVDEDWRFFNEAIRRKALGSVPPEDRPAMPPPSAPPETNNLPRALYVAAAVLLAIAAIVALTHVRWPTSLPSLWPDTSRSVIEERGEPVVTNYTTFNRVAYRDWSVVTGWNFIRSGDTVPTYQYCYLEVTTGVGKETYSIEDRPPGVRRPRPDALVQGLDDRSWNEAAQRCRWSAG